MTAANEYRFTTRWRVEGRIEEVYDILSRPADLPRWWPAVYLEVRELEAGDPDGAGKRVALHTRGWLPYTLRWQFRVTETRYPRGFSIEANGDFVGHGDWEFRQDGEFVAIEYRWNIRAEKPLLRYLSCVLKPVFAANHRWAMARGEESLRAEIARRHGHGSSRD